MQPKIETIKTSIGDIPKFVKASIPFQHEGIQVVVGSEESIFEETYVTGVIGTNRVAKFKKSTLVFA